jgi:hypothetical protein
MKIAETPPRLPTELPDLDRAILLLGSRSKGLELTHARRAELVQLIGAYPAPEQAKVWKLELKELRSEVAAEPDPESAL